MVYGRVVRHVWDRLKVSEWSKAKIGTVRIDYSQARAAWRDHYISYGISGDGYNNEVEKWAQNNATAIMDHLVHHPELHKQGQLCGFDLRTYTIKYVR